MSSETNESNETEKTVLLRVENLKQYFKNNSVRAVDDVSFEILKGEVLGLVGESGSGKTTTGRSIIGLYPVTGGKIYFKDELVNASRRGRKFNLGMQMIFQDPVSSLDPRMTVREIIAEGLRIKGVKSEQEITERVFKVLRQVGLRPEYIDRYPHEFSGGQRQRIGIARAIIMEPELIIADEPISALDVSIKAQIINLLNELKRSMNLTILFIAHDLSVVKYFCDRIAVMYAGKIVELAAGEELFSFPVHPYTKSLLSAIPLPDPDYEQKRARLIYNPKTAHDYSRESPCMREIRPEHFVLCSESEFKTWKENIK